MQEIWQTSSARYRRSYSVQVATNRLKFPHHRLTVGLKLRDGQSPERLSLAPVGVSVCGNDIQHSADIFDI